MESLKERIHEMVNDLALLEITQVDIAKAAGVTKGAVNMWLTGQIRSLKLEYAVKIEEFFGYRAIWLVLGKGPKLVSDGTATPSVPLESWPFSVPYSSYLALSMRARKQLDDKVSNFIEGFIEGAFDGASKEKNIKNAKTGTSS
ncbi:MAG: helix-turn-helix transcriptional regulator [Burkholderiaceae bacterium]|nr:helix-turn-helix transcriptional regulator [Burkholderiaceae bacterium]